MKYIGILMLLLVTGCVVVGSRVTPGAPAATLADIRAKARELMEKNRAASEAREAGFFLERIKDNTLMGLEGLYAFRSVPYDQNLLVKKVHVDARARVDGHGREVHAYHVVVHVAREITERFLKEEGAGGRVHRVVKKEMAGIEDAGIVVFKDVKPATVARLLELHPKDSSTPPRTVRLRRYTPEPTESCYVYSGGDWRNGIGIMNGAVVIRSDEGVRRHLDIVQGFGPAGLRELLRRLLADTETIAKLRAKHPRLPQIDVLEAMYNRARSP